MEAKKPRFSLKWGLLAIVGGCWLLPILLVTGIIVSYVSSYVQRQLDDNIRVSVENAANSSRLMLESAVTASRSASYDKAIYEAYRRFLQYENLTLLHNSVDGYLAQQYRYDEKFSMAVLCFLRQPDELFYTYGYTASYYRVPVYREVHAQVLSISAQLGTGVAFLSGPDGSIYMIRNLTDTNNRYERYAVLVMRLKEEAIFSGFQNAIWQSGVSMRLNGAEINLFPNSPLPQEAEAGQTPFESENPLIVRGGFETNTKAVRAEYMVEVNRLAFLKGLTGFVNFFYWLAALLVPLLVLAVWFFYHNIFRPINRIVEAAQTIERGDLGHQVLLRAGNREFAYLGEAFNGMSARIKQQFERLYSEELALRDARIMAMQSQINPHFLGNTLEIINWEARMGDNLKVSRMIEALGTMLDAAMDRGSLPLVPLSQEMMYVDAYLFIISERFGKRLTVHKEVDEAMLRQKVPRLILQPVLENAIEHGVSARQSGTVMIRARREEDRLLLEIENDSPLLPEDEVEVERLLSPDYDTRSGGSLHLGIHNVHMRLGMIYGEGAGLSLCNRNGATLARITIPLNGGNPPNQCGRGESLQA